jgi:hypothetical protein
MLKEENIEFRISKKWTVAMLGCLKRIDDADAVYVVPDLKATSERVYPLT